MSHLTAGDLIKQLQRLPMDTPVLEKRGESYLTCVYNEGQSHFPVIFIKEVTRVIEEKNVCRRMDHPEHHYECSGVIPALLV